MSAEAETKEPVAAAKEAAEPKPAPNAEQAQKSAHEKSTKSPLDQLTDRLPALCQSAGHDEMWGVPLQDSIPTSVILQKFLRANNNDVELAAKQLSSALEWRKKMNPGALLDDVVFDNSKFGDLGFVTVHRGAGGKEIVVTWNIYGAVRDKKATFGDIEEFIKWRCALMELGIRKLKLDEVDALIPDDGDDPYQMIQVHDYLNVSFLRMDPAVKAASKETIQTFSMAYPELLSHKFFVNVPLIMGWVYSAMKLILPTATVRKFHPLSNGGVLVQEIDEISTSTFPKEYGGSGDDVKTTGLTVRLGDVAPAQTKTESTEEKPAVEESKPAEPQPVTEESKPTESQSVTEKSKTAETATAEEAKTAVSTEAASTEDTKAQSAATVPAQSSAV